MSDFFKPEDFDDEAGGYTPACSAIARLANAKLKAHIESLPLAYKERDLGVRFGGSAWRENPASFSGEASDHFTHTARLWGIEEMKPKECEHIAILTGDEFIGMVSAKIICKKCRKVLKPSGGWEVCDE